MRVETKVINEGEALPTSGQFGVARRGQKAVRRAVARKGMLTTISEVTDDAPTER